ncbi:MAG: DEAD/DEAH box helicase [Acidobacteria bacterium]|nr:DEAD/DEAH box helicase [Acidobacteriota bacterium]
MTDAGGALQYDFELDEFQRRAIAALDEGQSVLVAAPTGSGKTVVAEHAIASALGAGRKTFYTAPIKALSNQKYGDLVRVYGADRVGLLTGDNSINGEAPIVVMTTEVLRNMIYAGSSTLDGLEYVVLDEVHYLQDAYRGPVWEEVIIHLPRSVRLVCLSATVSNAEELADWISTVRGPTAAVIEERRPIELHNLYLAGDRGSERLHLLPTLVDGRPNPEASRLDAAAVRGPRRRHERGAPTGGRRLYTPRRVEVVDRLFEERMLPAIYFIFSRAACDDAVGACLDAGIRLTSNEERQRIRAICDERVASLGDDDLDVLGWARWLSGMEAGIASHHAGMVPAFKEAVEACFTAGLVKVVFATETLSVGINMPARAVVLEKLSKFTGERHQLLTPGEYTQLTGRAGRRGIDEVGYAIVLWSPFVTFEQVANLVSTRTFAIASQFRPTYNMAANLVRRYEPDEAHHLLNLSFAQYQADRDIVRLESRLDRTLERIAAARSQLVCDRGDVATYLDAQRRLADARAARPSMSRRIDDALARLRPGDVVRTHAGPAVVLSATPRRGAMQLKVLTAKRNRHTLGPGDFDTLPRPLGRVELPVPYLPNSSSFQRQVAGQLRAVRLDDAHGDDGSGVDPELDGFAAAVDAHPVASCPDLPSHRRAAGQLDRLEREKATLERQVRGRSATIARQFDRVLRLLEDRGYLAGWALTPKGEQLSRLYHEADLLLAESLHRGLFDGLEPAALAGLVSTFVYERRGPGDGPAPWFPSQDVHRRWVALEALYAELTEDEEAAGLPGTRELDPGFLALAYAWAAGEALPEVLEDEELSGGDFVRVVKQLVDLLRQLAEVAPVAATRSAAGRAAEAVYRGVVSATVVAAPDVRMPLVVPGDDPEG